MSAKQSTRRPRKPKGSPLTVNSNGQWSKKVNGRVHYFGPWEDYDSALARFNATYKDLKAGRKPRIVSDEPTIADSCNKFLEAKEALVESGELTRSHWDELRKSCKRIVSEFDRSRRVDDLRPDDFTEFRRKLARGWNATTLSTEIARIRSVFNWCYKNNLIDRPVKFGEEFRKPSRKQRRQARNQRDKRLFPADEIRLILERAANPLRSMVLLAINSGMGQSDISQLPITAIDGSWIEYPRPKTEIERRIPLWPETVTALRETIDKRPKPKDDEHAGLVFVTKYGQPWIKYRDSGAWIDSVNLQFNKLLVELGIKRTGIAFYALRHTFRTVADGMRDEPAIKAIMGHADEPDDMSAIYRQEISDERLRAVVDHVHCWLFGGGNGE